MKYRYFLIKELVLKLFNSCTLYFATTNYIIKNSDAF